MGHGFYLRFPRFIEDAKITLPDGFSIKHTVSELLATAMFVYIGVGTAITVNVRPITRIAHGEDSGGGIGSIDLGNFDLERIARINLYMGSWAVTTALAFGLAIIVLAYATAGLSGGQMNPAVSFGLALAGAQSWLQTGANTVAQVVGAVLGSALLLGTMPQNEAGTLGSNGITPGTTIGNALCGEIIMTMVLMLVVLQTAVSGKEMVQQLAPLAIGFAVFCGHSVLLPIDGCSINPARSLGPAIVSGQFPANFWVFIVGPYLGALVAVPIHMFFNLDFEVHPSSRGLEGAMVGGSGLVEVAGMRHVHQMRQDQLLLQIAKARKAPHEMSGMHRLALLDDAGPVDSST